MPICVRGWRIHLFGEILSKCMIHPYQCLWHAYRVVSIPSHRHRPQRGKGLIVSRASRQQKSVARCVVSRSCAHYLRSATNSHVGREPSFFSRRAKKTVPLLFPHNTIASIDKPQSRPPVPHLSGPFALPSRFSITPPPREQSKILS